MSDVKWLKSSNWEVSDVYQKLPALFNEYLIVLRKRKKNDIFSETTEIKITSSKLYVELQELFEGKRERCYFAYGMRDIDVYRRNDSYVIMNSPHEMLYIEYVLSKKEFKRLLMALRPVKEKINV